MTLTVDQPSSERLDAWLASRLPELSRSRIQDLIREQYIQRNGQVARPRDSVKLGDLITVLIPEAVPSEAASTKARLTDQQRDSDKSAARIVGLVKDIEAARSAEAAAASALAGAEARITELEQASTAMRRDIHELSQQR